MSYFAGFAENWFLAFGDFVFDPYFFHRKGKLPMLETFLVEVSDYEADIKMSFK